MLTSTGNVICSRESGIKVREDRYGRSGFDGCMRYFVLHAQDRGNLELDQGGNPCDCVPPCTAYGLKLYHGIRPAVSHIVTILSGQNISKPGGAAQISMWCFRTQQLITTVCTYPARQLAPSIGCVVHRSGASSCLHEAKADACPNP